MSLLRVVIVGLALVVALPGHAAGRGWYFGGGLGQIDYGSLKRELNVFLSIGHAGSGIADSVVSFGPSPSGAAGDSLDADDSDIGWGAIVGYRILDYMAAELSYLDLGALRTREMVSLPSIPPDTLELQQELRTDGGAISILGILPVREHWELFVRVGLLIANQRLAVSSESTPLNRSVSLANEQHRSNAALWGAGVQYDWAHWSARLDFQRYREMEFADMDLLCLSVLYRL